MSLDQEPPDGDYAAYIDSLVNDRQGSPGAVGKSLARGARRRTDKVRNDNPAASGETSPGASSPGASSPGATSPGEASRFGVRTPPGVIRRDHNSHTEFEYVSPDEESGKAASLGPHGSAKLAGIVQIILGLGALALFARVAIQMTYSHDPFSLDYIVPLVLLGFIARMFLARGNARLREARSGGAPIGTTEPRRSRRSPRS